MRQLGKLLHNVEQEGGHSVVAVLLHDDMATAPLSHHVLTPILRGHILIPPTVSTGTEALSCSAPPQSRQLM